MGAGGGVPASARGGGASNGLPTTHVQRAGVRMGPPWFRRVAADVPSRFDAAWFARWVRLKFASLSGAASLPHRAIGG
eukprot:9502817-Pyramimonas_sp.AAC.1